MLDDADIRGASLLKLHTREVEGRLGGHVWSKKWAAYLHLAVSQHRREWWHDPYLVGVVARSLKPEALEAVLAWKLDGEDYHTVNARYHQRDHAWLGIQADTARKIAQRLYKN